MCATPQKRILIVTSGQPSLNPRMVKEADALANEGHDVAVLYSYHNDWATSLDRQLLANKRWKAVCVGGSPGKNRITYYLSRCIRKIANVINNTFGGTFTAAFAISRAGAFLTYKAKKYKADLYIGHNLGALPAVYVAAKKNGKPWGFDLEDLHRFEISDDENNHDVRLKKTLEDRYLPNADYLTSSSPLITEAYKKLFPTLSFTCICNVFPFNDEINCSKINEHKPIKLLWLSQTIGPKRGLEDIIKALQVCPQDAFELHLLGDISDEAKKKYFEPLIADRSINLYFHPPIPSTDLSVFASSYDIGLALEPGFCINNNLALSNKIFTYLNAGLAVIASDTDAQSLFIHEFPEVGLLYPKGETQQLAAILKYYHNNRDQLLKSQRAALDIAKTKLNWETESRKFLAIIEGVIAT